MQQIAYRIAQLNQDGTRTFSNVVLVVLPLSGMVAMLLAHAGTEYSNGGG
jgi:hypothetical protein